MKTTKDTISKETPTQLVGLSHGYNWGFMIQDKETGRRGYTQFTDEEMKEILEFVKERL